jgi:hypothetical protein
MCPDAVDAQASAVLGVAAVTIKEAAIGECHVSARRLDNCVREDPVSLAAFRIYRWVYYTFKTIFLALCIEVLPLNSFY